MPSDNVYPNWISFDIHTKRKNSNRQNRFLNMQTLFNLCGDTCFRQFCHNSGIDFLSTILVATHCFLNRLTVTVHSNMKNFPVSITRTNKQTLPPSIFFALAVQSLQSFVTPKTSNNVKNGRSNHVWKIQRCIFVAVVVGCAVLQSDWWK